jgi:hypothetical protein
MWQFNGVQTALTWASTKCGIPALHAHFVREFASQHESAVEALLHKVAQKGRTDVLEHLLQEGLLLGMYT